jgi:hypothetical protein
VPLELVCWTVPGVVAGGQVGPRIQAAGLVSQRSAEQALGAVFVLVRCAFLLAAAQGRGGGGGGS